MATRLFRVIVPVSDIEQGVKFYARVLGLAGQRVSPGRHYFDCEGTILACFDPQADGDGYEALSNPEPIYLATDDLEGAHATVQEAGGVLPEYGWGDEGPKGEIALRPWGERSFYAEDPFGNQICFVDRTTMFKG